VTLRAENESESTSGIRMPERGTFGGFPGMFRGNLASRFAPGPWQSAGTCPVWHPGLVGKGEVR
jgi:hypothetical protein